jgi:hypothetical protein
LSEQPSGINDQSGIYVEPVPGASERRLGAAPRAQIALNEDLMRTRGLFS